MNETVASLFIAFLYVLMLAIVARSLMSWFPVDQRNGFARVLYQVTEPILDPIRQLFNRIGLRFGMLDLSGLAAIILLIIAIRVVEQAANA